MLSKNGWGLGGRYHGWDMDALQERMGSGHGYSPRTDGVWVDDIMVGTWMLWQNGWGLGGRYHGWDMDALAERMGFWVDDIMVGTWMLWQNGWGLGGRYHGWDMDALLGEQRGRGGKKGWANDRA